MKLPISKGAHVSFEGDQHIWIVEDPETFQCLPDCPIMHEGGDCATEPMVRVKREIFTVMPVSQLAMFFAPGTGVGTSFVGGHHWDCKCEACA